MAIYFVSIRRRFLGAVKIIRPELPLAAGMCVVLGEVLAAGGFPGLKVVILGFCLGFCLSSSAMVFNDIFDVEVDRINSPMRPLPAGLLTSDEAIYLGFVMAFASLVFGWYLGPGMLLLTIAGWVLGFLYNWRLKANGIWGNLAVSTNVAATFILGGVAVGQAANPLVWVFGAIAFCFDLAEEIAGDAMDAEGDKARGSRSIAITAGKRNALSLSAALFGLVILLTAVPVALGERSLFYIIPMGIVDLLVAYFDARLLRSLTPVEGRGYMRALYLIASFGLLVFLLGSFIA